MASAPDQINVAQEEPTSFPLPSALVTAHEGISSAEQRDEHQQSGLADQDANQEGSSSDVTGSPGEEIPELQPLDLAGHVGVYRHACSGIPLAVEFVGRDRLL